MDCAHCKKKICAGEIDCTGLAREAEEILTDPEEKRMAVLAAEIEADGYGKLTRAEELLLFCRGMEYERLGIAFCIGLAEEAEVLADLLGREFEVHSVCCKVCGLSKDELGMKRLRPEDPGESACNPQGQALTLARADTQLNITVGLCVGHDVAFNKHSVAPVTAFVVKDRVLAHNPAAALYCRYHRNRLLPR